MVIIFDASLYPDFVTLTVYVPGFMLLISYVPNLNYAQNISSIRISERVFLITAGRQDNNMIIFLSKKGLVIVDTLMSQSFASEAKKIINKEFGSNQVIYVINTHGHWDHFQGNQVFKEAKIIGHESIIDAMFESEEGRVQSLPNIKERMERMRKDLEALEEKSEEALRLQQSLLYMNRLYTDLSGKYELTLPSLTFRENLTLHLNDITIHLYKFQGAHSSSDILIYCPEERILLVGDVFGHGWLPGFSSRNEMDFTNWMLRLEAILSAEAPIDYVVPGHGELMTLDELMVCMNYLDRLWKLVMTYSLQKSSLEQLQKKLALDRIFPLLNKDYESDENRIVRHKQNIESFWFMIKNKSPIKFQSANCCD